MKFISKLTFLIAIVLVVMSAVCIPSTYRIHYMLIAFILILGFMTIRIKKYHQIDLVPGVSKKHASEVNQSLICDVMGNLLLLITSLMIVFEIGELCYPGFINIFIWFSIIPIVIYGKYMTNKLSK